MAEQDTDKDNRTEEPTLRKLRKARQQGDVPSSREPGILMGVLSLTIIAMFLLPQMGPNLAGVLGNIFRIAGTVEIGEDRAGLRDVGQVTWSLARSLGVVLGPVLVLLVTTAIFGVLVQGETVVAVERIKPKMSKINPLAGFKRIFSVDALVEFLKSVSKVLFVGSVAVWVGTRAVRQIWQGEGMLPETLLAYIGRQVALLLIIVTVFLAVLSIVDVIWKRHRWMQKQRMTLQEVKEEHKENEGDPQIKARRMQQRRKRAKQRIKTAVPKATVILTNPTHFAVALRYEQGTDIAPVCVAKGADLMAAQIRKLALEHEVPIVENKPLARALFTVAEIDEQIPLEHWQAVAEIIGFLFDLKKNVDRRPPEGSSLRFD
ncbi:flagellar biosynthesis protein FlhB [Pseudooceanicola nanhaiensis]|uniref:flagellar biosynthesis protein FlhB n=1 Tax=Pseudooceanicola nanhaiensis TaxID=375761 RepID=UPI001CD2C8F0|nr:flagellar biosynthesis protein FlhB [Pseudooceanicola nanhaiensis]MCA0922663.1 flagellar biosynthesis protein FlhB [Pseudooceanicola nanhaiensis]